jgi:signal transduction histidine kinase
MPKRARYDTLPLGDVIASAIERPRNFENSALSRWWKTIIGVAWFHFIIFQLVVGYDRLFSKKPLCPFSDAGFGEVYWYSCFCCLGAFIMICLVLLIRIVSTQLGNYRVPYILAFNVAAIGTIASWLSFVHEWGGVCIDVLNVASPAASWAEWLSTGPLLIFITVTIVDKADLTRVDWLMIAALYVCLFAGFLIILQKSYENGVFWLCISCTAFLPVFYLPFHIHTASEMSTEGSRFRRFAVGYSKQTNVARFLTAILPFFAVNYFAALFGYIDAAQTLLNYQVLSVLTKGLFAAGCTDIQFEHLVTSERALSEEKRANSNRRAFMKYLFHEVRTPLNSLSLGIDMLQANGGHAEQDKEILSNMNESVNYMRDTLNNALSIQRIEEGMLNLEMVPFSIASAMTTVLVTLQSESTLKNIAIETCFSPLLPPNKLIGDEHRIQHVISNLVSNAIKFSPNNTKVSIDVTCGEKSSVDGRIPITISVTDEGGGVDVEETNRMFNEFVEVK